MVAERGAPSSAAIGRLASPSGASRSFGSEIRSITPVHTTIPSSIHPTPLVGRMLVPGISAHVDRVEAKSTARSSKLPEMRFGTPSGKPESNPLAPVIGTPVTETTGPVPTGNKWTEIKAKTPVRTNRIDIPAKSIRPVEATIGKVNQITAPVRQKSLDNSVTWKAIFDHHTQQKKAKAALILPHAPKDILRAKPKIEPHTIDTPLGHKDQLIKNTDLPTPQHSLRALIHEYKRQLPQVVLPHVAASGRRVPAKQMLGYFKAANEVVKTFTAAGKSTHEARIYVARQLATELQAAQIAPQVEPLLEALEQPQTTTQPNVSKAQRVIRQLLEQRVEGSSDREQIIVRDEQRNHRRKATMLRALRRQISQLGHTIDRTGIRFFGATLVGELAQNPQPARHKSVLLEEQKEKNDGGLKNLVQHVSEESGSADHMISVIKEGIGEHTAIRITNKTSWVKRATLTQIAEVLRGD